MPIHRGFARMAPSAASAARAAGTTFAVTATVVAAWLCAPPAATAAAVTLQVKGSDTIGGKLGQDFALAFKARHPEIDVKWEALGSGTAFVGLLDGSAQLGAASRGVKENEVAEARQRGIELREFVIGYDGIAVVVHPGNPVSELTVAQLSDLFTGKLRNWREVGGPDLPVHLISRPSYSGTFSRPPRRRSPLWPSVSEAAATTCWWSAMPTFAAAARSTPACRWPGRRPWRPTSRRRECRRAPSRSRARVPTSRSGAIRAAPAGAPTGESTSPCWERRPDARVAGQVPAVSLWARGQGPPPLQLRPLAQSETAGT